MKDIVQINIAFENDKVVELEAYAGINHTVFLSDWEEPISAEKAAKCVAEVIRLYKS